MTTTKPCGQKLGVSAYVHVCDVPATNTLASTERPRPTCGCDCGCRGSSLTTSTTRRCASQNTDLQVMTRGEHLQSYLFSMRTMQKWWRICEPFDACRKRHNKLADHSRSDRPGACHVSMFEFVVRSLQKTHWAESCRHCSDLSKLSNTGWLVWVHRARPSRFGSPCLSSLEQPLCSEMTSVKTRAAWSRPTITEADALVPSRFRSSMRLCCVHRDLCRPSIHHSSA